LRAAARFWRIPVPPDQDPEYFNRDGVGDEFSYGSAGPAAVAGYPNATVPAGFAGPQRVFPIGISFFSARRHDADVLDLAYAFETATQARRDTCRPWGAEADRYLCS
jgi:Asp-tRNA(Asn)/Glu-tRNA(Gln) amidotransferase A subunit family amidase